MRDSIGRNGMSGDTVGAEEAAASGNPDAEALRKQARTLLKEAAGVYAARDFSRVLSLTATAKGLKTPVSGLDYLRALAWEASGKPADAYEAVKEELRWFPENARALALYEILKRKVSIPSTKFQTDAEFGALYPVVRDYTMVPQPRLYSLFWHARDICQRGVRGNFVECGVAGGGSSGLLSRVIKDHCPHTETVLFCCDSFSGMPEPSALDTHNGKSANDTGWGTGTCSAPESSLLTLCEKLGSQERVRTIKGYFEDSLRMAKSAMGPIAFLHMDGDWYSSTKTILDELYDSLLPGAFVQVDDYGHWDGCSRAVHEFEEQRGLRFSLNPIDGTGVFFTKP